MTKAPLTIGRLACSAGVNVETVRYYQRLGFTLQEIGRVLKSCLAIVKPVVERKPAQSSRLLPGGITA